MTPKIPTNRLQIINEWWQERLNAKGKSPKGEDGGIKALQEKFVRESLKEIAEGLGIDDVSGSLVTVRSSFCEERRYLRPVYSNPKALGKFLSDPANQKPFRLAQPRAFDGVKVFKSKHGDKALTFIASYPIGAQIEASADKTFAGRIDSLHSRLLEHSDELRQRVRSSNRCFFAGRNKSRAANGAIELKHLLAIFFKGKPIENDALLPAIESLFDGLDLISRVDASIFEAEGLELVAELLPEFSRQDVAPADKISFALERLLELLKRHMIGRHGGVEPPKLFYIATTFERNDNKTFTPRLEVYPHIYRKNYPEVSFLVTHRYIPSATKFLIWRYLESNKHGIAPTTSASRDGATLTDEHFVKVDKEFAGIFSSTNLQTPDENWYSSVVSPEHPDFLHLTRLNERKALASFRTPWEALQKSAEANSRSIAAFVVEGRVIGNGKAGDKRIKRCLPRGIFAIESQYEDGFSDDDINSLRTVFHGVASLIRMISHQHAPIDYRSPIADTFEDDVGSAIPVTRRTNVRRLLFLVQKLDGKLFNEHLDKFIKSCENFPGYRINEKAQAILRSIAEICPGHENPSDNEKAKLLLERMKGMQTLLQKESADLDSFLTTEIMTFLEACPENFTWASYLACMAQTLGDRMDAGSHPPRFNRMLPGFSASGMFMAMVDGELRQVVKLSSADKLRRENKLYRKWVRYRLVNAARIPANGFAFETTGAIGQDSRLRGSKEIEASPEENIEDLPEGDKKTEAHGVLVSDLVSGGLSHEEKVRTLLDVVAKRLVKGPARKEVSVPQIRKINDEIGAVFGRHAMLWRLDVAKDLPNPAEQILAVFHSFRIPQKNHKSSDRILVDNAMQRLDSLLGGAGKGSDLENLVDYWLGQERRVLVGDFTQQAWAISHGDMNARNLTWAEGLQSFFLIDFEHVGPHLRGCDQMRLAVNLVTELWQGWESVGGFLESKQKKRLYTELHSGIEFLADVFSRLITTGDDGSLSAIVSEHRARKDGFDSVIKAILLTVDRNKLEARKWCWHWALMLFCSAVKDFSYTCTVTEEAEVNAILNGQSVSTISLKILEERVTAHQKKWPSAQSLRYSYLRHFVAARILIGFRRALSELPA